jgi:hypothetical protein
MAYVLDNLLKNERITYEARLHWTAVFSGKLRIMAAVGLLAAIGAVFLRDTEPGLYLGASAAGLWFVVLISGLVERSSSEFAVTNRRLLIKVGLVRRRTLDLNLSKVESVEVDQTVAGRLLGYGQIEVIGTGGSREAFDRVSQPLAFRKAVHEAAQALHEVRETQPAPVGEVVQHEDPVQRLEKAKAMLDKGLISPQEYADIRTRLLGGL